LPATAAMQDESDHLPMRQRLLTLRADQRLAEDDALDSGLMMAMRNIYPSGIFRSRNAREVLHGSMPGICGTVCARERVRNYVSPSRAGNGGRRSGVTGPVRARARGTAGVFGGRQTGEAASRRCGIS
jgi:hypothetical protein